jgi:hypothetical protein
MLSSNGLLVLKMKLTWNVPIYKYFISMHKIMFILASGM